VRISLGENSRTLAFTVVDRRGPRAALGGTPGIGGADTDDDQQESGSGEEEEEAEEREQERARETGQRETGR
jgi:hypothetical protein